MAVGDRLFARALTSVTSLILARMLARLAGRLTTCCGSLDAITDVAGLESGRQRSSEFMTFAPE